MHGKMSINMQLASQRRNSFFSINPLILLHDHRHSHGEDRWNALGKTDAGRLLHITFTLRYEQSKIRVISARDMKRKERAVYEQATKSNS